MEREEIIVVTNPMIAANRSAEVTLSKFLRVMKPSVKSIRVIGGNLSVEKDLDNVELISFPIVRYPSKIKRILAILDIQFKMMKAVIHHGVKNHPIYFWIADKMILPYLAAKVKKMEVNYFIYGNVEKEGTRSGFTAFSGKLIRYMASHADYVCVESPSVKNEWNGLEGKQSKVLHLYTDVVSEPEFDGRGKVLGMICRLTPGKHILECIEAMQLVHKKHPEWKLEIIGSGKQQRECEAIIEHLQAEQYIKLQGWVEHLELQNKVKKWKYLLFPTDTEGMPNGLIEMMGCGVPAIVSPVGGIADIIQDGVNGLILVNCSVSAITNGIYRAISISETMYREMAEKAYETIAGEFTLEAAQEAGRKNLSARMD